MSIDIVVCSVDRPKELLNCIQALGQMFFLPNEVIVVLGPNTQTELTLLKQLESPFPIKIIQTTERNLCFARNLGLKAGKSEYIAFIDDDAVPEPNWLRQITNPFDDPRIGLVGGWTRFQNSIRFQNQYQVVTENLQVRSLKSNEPPGYREFLSPLGANFAVRREAALEINGFDNFLEWWGDEADFAIRMHSTNYKVVFEPTAVVHHFQANSEFRKSEIGKTNVKIPWRSRAYLMAKHAKNIKNLGAILANDFKASKRSYEWALANRKINNEEFSRIISDIRIGMREGIKNGIVNRGKLHSGLNDLKSHSGTVLIFEKSCENARGRQKTTAFVYREPPGKEAGGITNWIIGMCEELGKRNQPAVYICAKNIMEPTHISYSNGFWIINIGIEFDYNLEMVDQDFPPDLQAFGVMARNLIKAILDNFNVADIIVPSFEGIGNVFWDDDRLVTSLHTSTKESLLNHPSLPFDALTQHRVDLINSLEERILVSSKRIIANSTQIVEKLAISDNKNLKVIPHGVKVPEITTSSHLNSRTISTPRISFIGRWEPRKGSEYLPRIIEFLLREGVEVSVIGDDPFQLRGKALRPMKKKFGNQLILMGVIDREHLEDEYLKSDVVIIPSTYESFGLVAIEALSRGCGIVAFSGSGIEETAKKCSNALFAGVGNIEEFAKQTILLAYRMFANQDSRKISIEFIERNFSISKVVDDFVKFLDS